MPNFTDSRAFSLLMTLILLVFTAWAIPTCMRGPVTESRLQQQEYYEKMAETTGMPETQEHTYQRVPSID